MCGRYWIDADDREIAELIAQMQRRPEGMKTSGELFPGDTVPALCVSRAGSVRAFPMSWGFTLPDGRRIINARSESAAQKPLFRESLRLRRCLLPMSAYFEWQKSAGARTKYRIAPAEAGLHFLMGIYRWEGARVACAVLTAPAALEIAFIHPRMPLILPAAVREDALRGEARIPNSPPLHFEIA